MFKTGLRPDLLPDIRPDLRAQSVSEVTPESLRSRGIEGVLVDLDDTLISSSATEPAQGVLEWLASLKAAGIAVAILSNGQRDRVAELAARAGVPGIAMAGKPFAWSFRRGLDLLGQPLVTRTAMIGDQLFTDVLGAKRAGLFTILVRPLSKGKLPHTRLARRLERMLLKE